MARAQLGVGARDAEALLEYLRASRQVLGALPSSRRVIAERFFDEAGGMQLILHAPFGGRVNRAWGLALRKRFCRTFDFELQAAATDDGILLSLGEQHSFPLADIFDFLHPDTVESVLVQAVLQAPLFGTRFRWDATRALALTPLPEQRAGAAAPAAGAGRGSARRGVPRAARLPGQPRRRGGRAARPPAGERGAARLPRARRSTSRG